MDATDRLLARHTDVDPEDEDVEDPGGQDAVARLVARVRATPPSSASVVRGTPDDDRGGPSRSPRELLAEASDAIRNPAGNTLDALAEVATAGGRQFIRTVPGLSDAVRDVAISQVRPERERREAALEEALMRHPELGHSESAARTAGFARLGGDLVREAAVAVPGTLLGGGLLKLGGRAVAAGARSVAPGLARRATEAAVRFAGRAPRRARFVTGTGRAAPFVAGEELVRETSEQDELNAEVARNLAVALPFSMIGGAPAARFLGRETLPAGRRVRNAIFDSIDESARVVDQGLDAAGPRVRTTLDEGLVPAAQLDPELESLARTRDLTFDEARDLLDSGAAPGIDRDALVAAMQGRVSVVPAAESPSALASRVSSSPTTPELRLGGGALPDEPAGLLPERIETPLERVQRQNQAGRVSLVEPEEGVIPDAVTAAGARFERRVPTARERGLEVAEEITGGGRAGAEANARPSRVSDDDIPFLGQLVDDEADATRAARNIITDERGFVDPDLRGSREIPEGQLAARGQQAFDALPQEAKQPVRRSQTNQRPGVDRVAESAREFNRSIGRPDEVDPGDFVYDPVFARNVAKAYQDLPPLDEAALPAYRQFASEVVEQFRRMTDEDGVEVVFTSDDPYRNSTEMIRDVAENNRLRVFTGGDPHPVLDEVDPTFGQTYNEMFRAVHDYYGHAAHGNSFGKVGEEGAFLAHSQMFTPEAQRAMATETRGQNSFFNFGDPNVGKPVTDRTFAQQKVAILPDEFLPPEARRSTGIRGEGGFVDPDLRGSRDIPEGAAATGASRASQGAEDTANRARQRSEPIPEPTTKEKIVRGGANATVSAGASVRGVAKQAANVAEDVTNIFTSNPIESAQNAAKYLHRLAGLAGRRTPDFLRSLGRHGTEYADRLTAAFRAGQKAAGFDSEVAGRILGSSGDAPSMRLVADALDGKIPSSGPEVPSQLESVVLAYREAGWTGDELRIALNGAKARPSKAVLADLTRLGQGRITREEADDHAVFLYDLLRPLFDRAMRRANEVGMTRNGQPITGVGDFMPQIPNRRGRKLQEAAMVRGTADSEVAAVVSRMMKTGPYETELDALAALRRYAQHERRGTAGYLEESRVLLPEEFIELNPNSYLDRFFERNWRLVEGVAQFGDDQKIASGLLEGIGRETNDPGLTRVFEDLHRTSFGLSQGPPTVVQRAIAAVSNAQTGARLINPFTTLRQIGQRFVNPAVYPVRAHFKGLEEFPPVINQFFRAKRDLASEIRSTGSVATKRAAIAEIEDLPTSRQVVSTGLNVTGFLPAEGGNQLTTAIIAKEALPIHMRRLMELSEEGRTAFNTLFDAIREATIPVDITPTVRGILPSPINEGRLGPRLRAPKVGNEVLRDKHIRALGRSGIDRQRLGEKIARGERITVPELEDAMILANEDINFVINALTTPAWWLTHPALRLMGKFRPFMVKQTGLLLNVAAKEAMKGNVTPLMRWFAASAAMGEMVNIPLDILRGSENSALLTYLNNPDQLDEKSEVALKMMEDIADGAGFAMFADLLFGVEEFVGGPVIGTAKSLKEFGGDVAKGFQLADGRPDERVRSRAFRTQVVNAIRELGGREITLNRQLSQALQQFDRAFNEDNVLIEATRLRNQMFSWRDDQDTPTLTDKIAREAVNMFDGKFTGFTGTEKSLTYNYAWRNLLLGDDEDAAQYLALMFEEEPDTEKWRKLATGMKRSAARIFPLSKDDTRAFLATLPAEDRGPAVSLIRRLNSKVEPTIRRAAAIARQARKGGE